MKQINEAQQTILECEPLLGNALDTLKQAKAISKELYNHYLGHNGDDKFWLHSREQIGLLSNVIIDKILEAIQELTELSKTMDSQL